MTDVSTPAPVFFERGAPLPIVTGHLWRDVADRVAPEVTEDIELFPKQQLAEDLSYLATELLFGGAAGPGKTEWGMEHVIRQMLAYPKNHGIIFRRIFPSLQQSVIPRMRDKLEGRATWNGGRHDFTFPNGSVLTLGHLMLKDSVRMYQGAQFGVIFFEEVTEFLESQYTYMLHRLRAPDLESGVVPHVISTTNPGGVGHAWVKRRFVRPLDVELPLCATCFGADPHCDVTPTHLRTKNPVPIKYQIPWEPRPTDENPEPLTRVFIPATMEDNPILMREDPGYRSRVRAISDRGLRLAMETGDWDVIDQVEGALWEQSWFDEYRLHRLPTTPSRRVVAVDPSDGTEAKDADEFGVWVGCLGMDGVAYTEFSDGWMQSPAKMARRAIQLGKDMNADAIVIEKNHGGAWLKTVFLGIDPNANVILVHASHGKITRAEPVAALFDPERSEDGSVRARVIGYHSDLEGECTTYAGDPGDESPNRMDAMVWGHSELMFGTPSGPAKANHPTGSTLPRTGSSSNGALPPHGGRGSTARTLRTPPRRA
jgi:phage terminase large subunit-like protein